MTLDTTSRDLQVIQFNKFILLDIKQHGGFGLCTKYPYKTKYFNDLAPRLNHVYRKEYMNMKADKITKRWNTFEKYALSKMQLTHSSEDGEMEEEHYDDVKLYLEMIENVPSGVAENAKHSRQKNRSIQNDLFGGNTPLVSSSKARSQIAKENKLTL